MKRILSILILACLAPVLHAEDASFRLHPLFTDHGVLQQELPVPVWGWAEPGAEVSVSFAGQEHDAVTNEAGRWMVVLDPLTRSTEGRALTATSESESLEVKDLLVGEVWVASGQSNMAMAVGGTLDAEDTTTKAADGAFEGIRLFKTPVAGADERQETVKSSWVLPNPKIISTFSATGFYFAAKLAADRDVPVGVIQTANGGTNAYSWINGETLRDDPVAETTRAFWKERVRNHPAAMERYRAAVAKWDKAKATAKKAGEKFKKRAPREPIGPGHVKRPAGHYNAMVAPLQPYAVRGAIWYQGEANSRLPFYPGYKDLMLALVEDWRADWTAASGGKVERRDFPFYLVQLPNYDGGDPVGWPMIREQMLRFWQDGKNTGTVVAIDKGEADDIHPRDKRPVGERLALFARSQAYGEDLVYSGPIFDSLRIEGKKAILGFQHVGGGLASLDGEALRHFQVAGADRKFTSANAVIENGRIVVSSEKVADPRAVRYAWERNPEGINFGNAEGLPASPFRTDNWEE